MARSVDQALLKAKKHAKNGEAEQLYKPKVSPTLSPAELPQDQLNALIALYNQGRLVEVVQQATSIAAEFPNAFVLYNILGAANAGLGNLDGAIASVSKALQIKPDYAEAHNSLGIALQGQGRLEEAIASYGKALQIKPDFAEAHNNLGIALQGQGRLEEAIASYGNALQIKPDFAEVHNNLGAALKDQGRLDEAIASFGKALRIKHGFAEAHNNLGAARKDQGRLEEAIASFGKALQIKPDHAEAHNNLGIALQGQGRLEEAIASFGKALQIKPDYAEAHSNLCGLYEKQNNLGELEKALEKAARNCGEDNSDILCRLAQLANLKKQFEDAAGYLNKVQVQWIQPSLKPVYFNLLGKSCDKLDQFEEAFSAFEKQNELIRISAEAKKFNADGYLNSILLRKEAWTTDVKPIWANSKSGVNQTSPAFLIGFPRSGTTLLDTILRSHPGIGVVEEKPMVTMMGKAFKRAQTIQNFNTLSKADVFGLRDVYFKELKLHLDQGDDGKLIVDKFPLNIGNIGIIHRVFPDAKFILALRHPCDCVLSCFMQTFNLNDAMANFLSLDQSAKLYAAVMELWSVYRQKLNFDVHALKYEDLVQDFEGTCKSLIKFLGLEWDDNLHNYQKTALDRGRINTPSYNQVIQPLYKQASGRWTNYQEQMQPVLPVLQPWIEAFGY
jgi:tetratricopeptide (TPR) repeat protein